MTLRNLCRWCVGVALIKLADLLERIPSRKWAE